MEKYIILAIKEVIPVSQELLHALKSVGVASNTDIPTPAQDATTTNGAVCYHTSGAAMLDLFSTVGTCRGKNISGMLDKAIQEDTLMTMRMSLYVRDVRGGMGERELFNQFLMKFCMLYRQRKISLNSIRTVIAKAVEVGRYTDIIDLLDEDVDAVIKDTVLKIIHTHLADQKTSGLLAKWLPIKGPIAKVIYKSLGIKNEQAWRKFVVPRRSVVETLMCAKEWGKIEYAHVPSVASARYQKTFSRRDGERYGEYLAAVESGEAKINASAVYPYDITKSVLRGDSRAANAQWKRLPNYLEGSTQNIMCLIDVSYSMSCPTAISGVTCMDAARGIGLYLCERTEGKFKNSCLTFDSVPALVKFPEHASLTERIAMLDRAPWGGSTNISKAFEVILNAAIAGQTVKADMPSHLVILSDMQFDHHNVEGRSVHIFDDYRRRFANAGYDLPTLVFWNLKCNGDAVKVHVTAHETGTMLVSGLSPAIMKTVMTGNSVSPIELMLETLLVDRYDIPQ